MLLEILSRKFEESTSVEKEPHCVFICFVPFHLQWNIYNHVQGDCFWGLQWKEKQKQAIGIASCKRILSKFSRKIYGHPVSSCPSTQGRRHHWNVIYCYNQTHMYGGNTTFIRQTNRWAKKRLHKALSWRNVGVNTHLGKGAGLLGWQVIRDKSQYCGARSSCSTITATAKRGHDPTDVFKISAITRIRNIPSFF